MTIQHENVQLTPRLPFKYYKHDPLTSINVSPHWHQGIELNCLMSGATLKFVTNGVTNEYHPGDVWAVNRRVIHSVTGPSKANWSEFGFIIDDNILQSQFPASTNWQITLQGSRSSQTNRASYGAIREHLIAIHDLISSQVTDLSRMSILGHFFMILAILGESFTVPMIAQDANPNPPLIDTVMNAINRDYAQQLTGTILAEQFHVSLTTLNQQFNINLQMSVNRYIRLVRLMNSRRLLLETDKTVDYIAVESGFTNGKTFNRNFKSWKGMTPTEYRQAYARYHKNDTSCL
ncbi:AraC family transcriptional regulator [Sporolactobacillus pectinivorans]|uniref:AraC family transcriptional regulator n=1 Tax=Sporolactobacillus pectinivorans TaxID=1591408 RepID=UPI000C25937D|nr:helix-turn-helix transcriptional regulator [Sporolactobacillus pectinivorans]